MRELLTNYLDNKTDAISTIRTLSGMFNPDYAVDILAVICSITRVEQGDMDRDAFKEVFKL